MTESKKNTAEYLIQAAGFEPLIGEDASFQFSRIEETNRSSEPLPLQLTAWHIRKRASSWITTQLQFEIDSQILQEQLTKVLKHRYGSHTLVDFRATNDNGEFTVFLEYTKSRGKRTPELKVSSEGNSYLSPHGVVGFKVTIFCDATSININIFDHFAVGAFPPDLFIDLPNIVRDALFLGETRDYTGLYEQKYHLGKLLMTMLSRTLAHQKVSQLFAKGVGEFGFAKKASFYCDVEHDCGWFFHYAETKVFKGLIYQPAIEVLEERELPAYKAINRNIVEQKMVAALKVLEPELTKDRRNIFLIRRMALLHISGYSEMDPDMLDYGLSVEPDNLLFISSRIRMFLLEEQHDSLGECLFQLKTLLSAGYPDIDQLPSMTLVLPEMLADAVFYSEPQVAEDLYHRIIDQRGELARVLTKLTRLVRYQKDESKEREHLHRLLKIERRPGMQVYIYFQLAKLLRPVSFEQAIDFGIHALEISPHNKDVALLVADIKTENDLPHEAIQTLTDSLAAMDASKQKLDRAELELAIGKIWQNALKRDDLAEIRYENALTIVGPNRDFLVELAQIYKENGNDSGYERVCNLLFELELKETNQDRLYSYLDSLLQIHIDKNEDYNAAFALYLKVLDKYLISYKIVDRMLTWDISGSLWLAFIEKMRRYEVSELPAEDQFHYFLNLARIYRDKLDQMDEALPNFYQAVHHQRLGSEDLGSVQEHCFATQKTDLFANILDLQLKYLEPEAFVATVSPLLSSESPLATDKIDQLALRLYILSPSHDEALKGRIAAYCESGNFERMDKMLAAALDIEPDNRAWLTFACDLLLEHSSERKYEPMERYINLLMQSSDERVDALEKGVAYLKESGRHDMLRSLAIELIDAGVLPDLDEARLCEVLKDYPFHQAGYFLMKMRASVSSEQTHIYSLKSWDLLKDQAGLDKEKEEALLSLGQYQELEGFEIEVLKDAVAKDGHWAEFISLIRKQIALTKSADQANLLRRELIAIYEERYADVDKVLEIYDELCTHSPEPELIVFEVAEYALKKDVATVREYILSCVYNEICWQHLEWMKKVFLWLIVDLKDISTVKHVLVTKIKDMASKGEIEKSCFYGNILIDYNILNKTICWNCFQQAVNLADKEAIYKFWSAYASLLSSPDEVKDFITECHQVFEISGLGNLLEEIIIRGISEGFLYGLSFAAENEFKIFYAKCLFERKEKPEVAIAIYREYYNVRPDDSRIWTSYFFLLKENDCIKEAIALLNEIIPRIERNDDLIKDSPVTAESLKKDLADLYTIAEQEPGRSSTLKPLPIPKPPQAIASAAQAAEAQDARAKEAKAKEARAQKAELQDAEAYDRSGLLKAAGDSFITSTASNLADSPSLRLTDTALPPPVPTDRGMSADRGKVKLSTDWKYVVSNLEYFKDMTKALNNKEFDNELEKHLAIQAFSLISGETEFLKSWPYKVWRQHSAYNYTVHQDRLPETIHSLKSDAKRDHLLQLLTPLIKRAFFDDFSVKRVAKLLKCSDEMVVNERKPILWTDDYFASSGLRVFVDAFTKVNFNAFHMAGLKHHVVFVPDNNAIYFDRKYYRDRPPTHLQHKILHLWNQAESGKYHWLSLGLRRQILPFLDFCRTAIENQKVNRIKLKLGVERSPILRDLFRLNVDRIGRALDDNADLNRATLSAYFERVREFLYLKQLADTLDLIGMSEWILDIDVFAEDADDIRQKLIADDLASYLVKSTPNILV